MNDSFSRHYVPAEPKKKDFPFTFELEEISEADTYTTMDYISSRKDADLVEELRLHIIPIFDFHKYLDEFSEDNIIKDPSKSPEYIVKVRVYTEVSEDMGYTATGSKRKPKVTKIHVDDLFVKLYNFKSQYQYTLIRTINQLEEVLKDIKVFTYDVETSSLDAEFGTIAGINFATSPYKGYYIPIAHTEEFKEYNLGEPALDIYYKALMEADKVYLFNARFDIRYLEYYKYDEDGLGNITNKKYDLSKLKFIDTQITTYFADPEWRRHDMDWAEKHFLGFYRPDLAETLKAHNLKDFDTTKIDPRNLLFYAAQDGITTFRLGIETEHFIDEFKLSGQIDMEIIYPLMDMENRLIKIDTEYLKETLDVIRPELESIQKEIEGAIGADINLNSPKQKIALFESFGLDTGERTKTGNMSTGRDAVNNMIERLEAQGKDYPKWLKLLGRQSKLQQLESTFFNSLYIQAQHRDGRVRLNYRHGVTSTGRFSSGKEQ